MERGTAWLGYALQEGIKHGLTDAREMLAHATPEVLVAQLPRELTSQLIAGALKTGRLTPESVLEVAPPSVVAEPPESTVVWCCLRDAAEAANLTTVGGTASAAGRRWMGDILGRAIADGLTSAEDVVKHVPPPEWVKDAPPHVISAMLAHGLAKGVFDPKLALEYLTPEVMAENLSPPLVWKCIVDAAQKTFGLGDAASQAADTLEKAAASMSAAKLEAMVVRQSPIVSRPLAESDSWEPNAVSDDEVIEETAEQLPPPDASVLASSAPPPPSSSSSPGKKKPAPAPVSAAAKR
jgi:hypothetical protein